MPPEWGQSRWPNAAWRLDAATADEPVKGLHELVQQQIAPGQGAAATESLRNTWLPLLREAGAHEHLRVQFAEQRRTLGTTLFQRSEVNLLEPAEYALIRANLGRTQE